MLLKNKNKFNILFVCMGNICRSPTAKGVFEKLAKEKLNYDLVVDSAGTTSYHVGEPADPRAITAASKRGYDLSTITARQVTDEDFENFDLIVAMDKDNVTHLIKKCEASSNSHCVKKIKLFLAFSNNTQYEEVPDPYYAANTGFNLVIDLIENASLGLIESINNKTLK